MSRLIRGEADTGDQNMARLTPEEMDRIAREDVPGVAQTGVQFEEIGDGVVRARLPFREDSIRPGGTVNGPTMMGWPISSSSPACSRGSAL